jgi:hypothetical protein
VAAQNKFIEPSKTRYPAKGMINSEGRGMQADSIAIRRDNPTYPVMAMTEWMNTKRMPRIFSVMKKFCRDVARCVAG